MRIRVTIEQTGKTACGFQVPPDVVAALGKGQRPPVRVTIGSYTYRNTVAPMGGSYWIGVSAEHRAAAGVTGGQTVDVDLELDTAPRVAVVPPDFAAALDAEPAARAMFDTLSYSNQNAHVVTIDGTKNPETRQRRIEKAVATLKAGKAR